MNCPHAHIVPSGGVGNIPVVVCEDCGAKFILQPLVYPKSPSVQETEK